MSSIKQLIVNAIIKVSGENPTLNREGEPTMEQARDDFIKLLLAELFPEDPAVPTPKKTKKTKKTKDAPVEVVVEKTDDVAPPLEPVPAPEAAAESPKKTKKSKKAPEAAVEPAQETAVPVPAEPAAASPEKKKRAPMSEEAKAAMKAKREATLAAKKAAAAPAEVSNAAAGAGGQPELEEGEVIPTPVKEKKTKKTKPAEDANLPKLDPTWKKHLKNADKEHAKELEPELLKFLNAMSKEDFNSKKAEEHVTAFINSRKVATVDEKVEAELVEIEFNGKTYAVNPETKRVYEGEGEFDEETGWTNYKPVGYVGMAAFAEMSLDD